MAGVKGPVTGGHAPKSAIDLKNEEMEKRRIAAEARKAQDTKELTKAYKSAMKDKDSEARAVRESTASDKERQELAAESKAAWERYERKAEDLRNIRGYDDWGTSMLGVFAMLYDFQLAMAIDLGFRKFTQDLAWQGLDNLGELIYGRSPDLPVVTCDFNAIKLKQDGSGEVDLSAYKPMILGRSLEEYFPKDTNLPAGGETRAALCERLMKYAFKAWLEEKGYELVEAKDAAGKAVERIVHIEPGKADKDKQGISAAEFAKLNTAYMVNNTQTKSLTDYFAERFEGVPIEPEVDNRPGMSP